VKSFKGAFGVGEAAGVQAEGGMWNCGFHFKRNWWNYGRIWMEMVEYSGMDWEKV